jgi:hypothetical protein
MKKRAKTTPAGKPAAKKPGGRLRAAVPKTPRETRRSRLQKLLFEAVGQMDEEGLVFLLRQAHVLRSNANAERINREIEAYERDRGPAPETAEIGGVTASIEASPDGKSYFLALNNVRKALTREELGGIVRVCLGAVDREVGMRNLFRALGRERGDILVDAKIAGPKSPVLGALYDTVLEMSKKS